MSRKEYKRHNECVFCTSRKCYEHIHTVDDNGALFNEVACRNHVEELYKLAGEKIPKGVMRMMTGSTGELSRRDVGENNE